MRRSTSSLEMLPDKSSATLRGEAPYPEDTMKSENRCPSPACSCVTRRPGNNGAHMVLQTGVRRDERYPTRGYKTAGIAASALPPVRRPNDQSTRSRLHQKFPNEARF